MWARQATIAKFSSSSASMSASSSMIIYDINSWSLSICCNENRMQSTKCHQHRQNFRLVAATFGVRWARKVVEEFSRRGDKLWSGQVGAKEDGGGLGVGRFFQTGELRDQW